MKQWSVGVEDSSLAAWLTIRQLGDPLSVAMTLVLRLAALLALCCEATDASSPEHRGQINQSAHVQGTGFAVAAESKQTLAGKSLRGHATKESEEPIPDDDIPVPMPSVHFIADYLDMAAKQINTQLAYIPARPYLNIITNSSPVHLQMAGLAAFAYDLDYMKTMYSAGWAGGWKVVAEYVNTTQSLMVDGHDVVVLAAKGKNCAISFSGTHGLADWSTNLNVGTSNLPECGVYGVHEGFFEAFLQFMLNDAWTDSFEPYIAENCTEGVHVTGHSQGAAVGAA